MARIDTLDNFLTDVADSIREKKGTTEPILAKNFDTEIESISGGGSSDDFYIDDCSYLFYNGARIEQFNNLKKHFKDVVNGSCMFGGTYNKDVTLDLSGFDTSKVQDMSEMFKGIKTDTLDLSGFNGENVITAYNMFQGCRELLELTFGSFNLKNVTNITSIWNNCRKLKSLDLSGFDFSNVNSNNGMLSYCNELANLKFCINLGKGYKGRSSNNNYCTIDLSTCTNLTHDSLKSVIDNLYDLNLTYDVANGGTLYTQKLVFGSTNLAKLTQTEIQIATNKGWTVS